MTSLIKISIHFPVYNESIHNMTKDKISEVHYDKIHILYAVL